MTITFNQARFPVEGLLHEDSHIPFNLQFVLSTSYAGLKIAVVGVTNRLLVQPETHVMIGILLLVLLAWSAEHRGWIAQRPRMEQT